MLNLGFMQTGLVLLRLLVITKIYLYKIGRRKIRAAW